MGKALPHTDTDQFINRHIGPRPGDIEVMLETLGFNSLDALIAQVVPEDIRLGRALDLPPAAPEHEVLAKLAEIAKQNQIFRSFIGMGYANCITPAVIQRNILESPGWYTAYTPYQAEIAQGRLEALLNFQTMVSDLTGLEIANASLLDEATAAAEAMTMTVAVTRPTGRTAYLVDQNCHPQTIAVLETRAEPRGMELRVGDPHEFEFTEGVIGALVQYPRSDGGLTDPKAVCERAHTAGALVTVATDLLGLTLLKSPGELGADVAIGNSQRFGVPLGYGGPHAAFFATRSAYKRLAPGRIIGISRDSSGNPALRMALQTREQHIRRDKATSNICTAQVLLAVVAGAYAIYHGPEGLVRIARRVHALTVTLAELLERSGHKVMHDEYFDTLCVKLEKSLAAKVLEAARKSAINLRDMLDGRIGISLDEISTLADVAAIAAAFGLDHSNADDAEQLAQDIGNRTSIPDSLRRTSSFLTHPVFHRYRSETEMLRYLKKLEVRDLSLTSAMIPLGSCTMKLNATVEMIPITWPEFANVHPFAPREQARGYQILFNQLEAQLAEISGLPHTSLQPNAGSQGEFSGLLTIKAYHRARGGTERSICLIPSSAHGTNPASAVMAGLEVVAVATDMHGNIDMDDLRTKAQEHHDELAALMVTYPSTHGVFESTIREVCEIIHEHGGQVYMDGANLNAQVGLCRPGDIGADVCHINLHKTFCIPHGGGGPGMGPICAADHLAPFLPDHPVVPLGHERSSGTISAAPWGSPSILPISWAYLALTGPDGQKTASEIAILNANYIARRLQDHFPLVYSGRNNLIAHECIVDGRPFKATAGVDVADIATRLMDYGFHAPTVSWPVHGTLMVEPTESESKEELDRFCDAMISIREEIREIEDGRAGREINLLKMAPHTLQVIASDDWDRPYSRERAAFPSRETRDHKCWPTVGRVDGAYGDRHLVCSHPPVAADRDAAEPVGS